MKEKKKYKVLFCDLDDTLIETVTSSIFPQGIWDMKPRFDVWDAIKNSDAEFIYIVSNQGGIEENYYRNVSIACKIQYVAQALEDYINGNKLKKPKDMRWCDFMYCGFSDPECGDRKPNTGMLEYFWRRIENKYDKSECLMIGDARGEKGDYSNTDRKTAENFGIDYMDVSKFVEKYGNRK